MHYFVHFWVIFCTFSYATRRPTIAAHVDHVLDHEADAHGHLLVVRGLV